jgi:hypothetical protein
MDTQQFQQFEGSGCTTGHFKVVPGRWQQFVIVLAVLALVLVACGGGAAESGGQAADNGDAGDGAVVIEGTDKGTIEYAQPAEDTIANADDVHLYRFDGAAGEQVLIRINATGSTFNAPYVFLYSPENTLLTNTDTSARSRSARTRHTLEADGTYTLVVQVVENVGVGGYEVVVELEE